MLEGLQRREAALKKEIDRRYWRLSKQLNKIKEGANEHRGQLMISQRLVSSLDDISLLRASKPIITAMQGAITNAKEPVPPYSLDTEYYGFSSIASGLGCLSLSSDEHSPIYCLQFAARRDGVRIYGNNQIADTAIEGGKRKHSHGGASAAKTRVAIYSHHLYGAGVTCFKVQLLKNAKNHMVGISPNGICFSKPYGWAGNANLVENTRGGSLGLPWEDGDVLTLSLNSSRNELSAIHERTRSSDSISLPSNIMAHFKIDLCHVGSARILPLIAN